ncbi:MAG: flagellar hook-length control protein FliK [Colwellia sp.]|nr:flagellar hook-length control protein FliK [Colwellia sp.]
MQPASVLPVFVSQDTDLKTKGSSTPSESRDKEADFSRLVEQHVNDKSKVTSDRESQRKAASSPATNGNAIAGNGKNDTDEVNSRQESDSAEQGTANESNGNQGNTNQDSANLDSTNLDNTEQSSATKPLAKDSDKNEDNPANNKALTESEQFIALLYNSDQTLTNAADKSNKSEQANSKQINPAINGTADITDVKNQSKKTSQDADGNERSDLHKLEAFSKNDLLARAQLKEGTLALQPSDNVLKDYQQLLQSQQSTIKSQSITSEQLMNTQLTAAQLENNKVTDLAANISAASKSQLSEQVDSGLYQLPVEPIGKGKLTTGEESLLAKASVDITKVVINKSNTNSVVKTTGDELLLAQESLLKESAANSFELAGDATEASELVTKNANNTLTAMTNKASHSESKLDQSANAINAQLSKVDLDKVMAERPSQALITNEVIAKEQPLDTQIKQPSLTNVQGQALQQSQQQNQTVNSEQQSLADTSAEYDEAMLLSQEKPVESGVKVPNKVSDNITTRSFFESQALTMQATQTKQSNDAYIEHQASEILNHTVASDTAQIQKNNVQLQQETIAIFRKDFADAVKDKVMLMINQKLQQFDITLDPPEFGNMQVRVNLQGEQASVNFVVQNQQAKDALEQNMSKLKDMLAEQGVDVGEANVEQQNQQQSNDENNLNSANDRASLSTSQDEGDHTVEHTLSAKLFDSSATGVDYYA